MRAVGEVAPPYQPYFVRPAVHHPVPAVHHTAPAIHHAAHNASQCKAECFTDDEEDERKDECDREAECAVDHELALAMVDAYEKSQANKDAALAVLLGKSFIPKLIETSPCIEKYEGLVEAFKAFVAEKANATD